MNLDRRSFLQTAALSTAAVLHGTARASGTENQRAPREVDLAEPGATKYVDSSATELFVRLEELYQADPGELSGAVLHICNSGKDVSLGATFGKTPQPYRERTAHFLGYMEAASVRTLASLDLAKLDRNFAVGLQDRYQPLSNVYALLCPGKTLRIEAGGHCFGVLRGGLLLRFLDCLRQRSQWSGAEAL